MIPKESPTPLRSSMHEAPATMESMKGWIYAALSHEWRECFRVQKPMTP